MRISKKEWNNYIAILRKLQDKASSEMLDFIEKQRLIDLPDAQFRQALIDYALALATKYGEGATAAACDIYDAVAALQNVTVDAAVPAETATYNETAKAVNGTLKTGNDGIVSDAVGRLVKMAGVDTVMQNALRDGAEWAWIPQGDTCAFCYMLASRGWQRASKNAIRNGHAEHIHANCDCTYAIRFRHDLDVEGYDPDKYLEVYQNAEGRTYKDKLNSMRREFYAENKKLGVNLGDDMEEGLL